ncbi:ribonuclease M5 [Clostridia bacterium]|nr:ribonuclease M5 [Clostridia bacterium]
MPHHELISVKEAIIVEGRYDKIALRNVVQATIVETYGFGIRKDPEKIHYVKELAKSVGVIILTDSDVAGFQIRRFLCEILPKESVKHAYIPPIFGKERRKKNPSKEGKLGVEGVNPADLVATLEKSGATICGSKIQPSENPITNLTLYNDGLIGKENSKRTRLALFRELDLPEYLSAKELIEFLNTNPAAQKYAQFINRQKLVRLPKS